MSPPALGASCSKLCCEVRLPHSLGKKKVEEEFNLQKVLAQHSSKFQEITTRQPFSRILNYSFEIFVFALSDTAATAATTAMTAAATTATATTTATTVATTAMTATADNSNSSNYNSSNSSNDSNSSNSSNSSSSDSNNANSSNSSNNNSSKSNNNSPQHYRSIVSRIINLLWAKKKIPFFFNTPSSFLVCRPHSDCFVVAKRHSEEKKKEASPSSLLLQSSRFISPLSTGVPNICLPPILISAGIKSVLFTFFGTQALLLITCF